VSTSFTTRACGGKIAVGRRGVNPSATRDKCLSCDE